MLSQRQLFLDHIAQTSGQAMMLEVISAKGIYIFSPSGEKYIDLIAGVSVSAIGHSDPEVQDCIKAQVDKHMHVMVYGEFIQSPQVIYAQTLCNALGNGFDNVYFVNSGSEAIEGAIKLSRKYTGRGGIVSFENAYHGSTLGALSIMGGSKYKKGFHPLIPGTHQIRFNSNDDLDYITENTACVIMELIQAEAGVILPEMEFLENVRKRCDETGALLVFDEIQTGFGRTGELFAFQKYNCIPDILVLAKSLGGGMPLGAFISRKEIMQCLSHDPPLGHITTFGGHPVSCAAGLSTLNIILRESMHETAIPKENIFRQHLVHPLIREIRGTGLLLAADLQKPEIMHQAVTAAFKNGIITDWFLFNDKSIRISPPLTITEDEIIHSCRLLIKSLDEIIP